MNHYVSLDTQFEDSDSCEILPSTKSESPLSEDKRRRLLFVHSSNDSSLEKLELLVSKYSFIQEQVPSSRIMTFIYNKSAQATKFTSWVKNKFSFSDHKNIDLKFSNLVRLKNPSELHFALQYSLESKVSEEYFVLVLDLISSFCEKDRSKFTSLEFGQLGTCELVDQILGHKISSRTISEASLRAICSLIIEPLSSQNEAISSYKNSTTIVAAPANSVDLSGNRTFFSTSGSIYRIIKSIETHLVADEVVLEWGLRALVLLSNNQVVASKIVTCGGAELVCLALENYSVDESIIVWSCRLLNALLIYVGEEIGNAHGQKGLTERLFQKHISSIITESVFLRGLHIFQERTFIWLFNTVGGITRRHQGVRDQLFALEFSNFLPFLYERFTIKSASFAQMICWMVAYVTFSDDFIQNQFSENQACEIVVECLRFHSEEVVLQEALRAIHNLASDNPATQRRFVELDIVSTLERLSDRMQERVQMLPWIWFAVSALIQLPEVQSRFDEAGVCQKIAHLLISFPENADLMQWLALTISTLAQTQSEPFQFATRLGDAGICDSLINVLGFHLSSPDVTEEVLFAITCLSQNSLNNQIRFAHSNHSTIGGASTGALPLQVNRTLSSILEAIQRHDKEETVVIQGMGALAALLSHRFLDRSKKSSKSPQDSQKSLSDSSRQQLLDTLAFFIRVFTLYEGHKLVSRLLKKFSKSPSIMRVGCVIINELSYHSIFIEHLSDANVSLSNRRDQRPRTSSLSLPKLGATVQRLQDLFNYHQARPRLPSVISSGPIPHLDLFRKEGACEALVRLITTHLTNSNLVLIALLALLRLSLAHQNIPTMREANVCQVLIHALYHYYSTHPILVAIIFRIVFVLSHDARCQQLLSRVKVLTKPSNPAMPVSSSSSSLSNSIPRSPTPPNNRTEAITIRESLTLSTQTLRLDDLNRSFSSMLKGGGIDFPLVAYNSHGKDPYRGQGEKSTTDTHCLRGSEVLVIALAHSLNNCQLLRLGLEAISSICFREDLDLLSLIEVYWSATVVEPNQSTETPLEDEGSNPLQPSRWIIRDSKAFMDPTSVVYPLLIVHLVESERIAQETAAEIGVGAGTGVDTGIVSSLSVRLEAFAPIPLDSEQMNSLEGAFYLKAFSRIAISPLDGNNKISQKMLKTDLEVLNNLKIIDENQISRSLIEAANSIVSLGLSDQEEQLITEQQLEKLEIQAKKTVFDKLVQSGFVDLLNAVIERHKDNTMVLISALNALHSLCLYPSTRPLLVRDDLLPLLVELYKSHVSKLIQSGLEISPGSVDTLVVCMLQIVIGCLCLPNSDELTQPSLTSNPDDSEGNSFVRSLQSRLLALGLFDTSQTLVQFLQQRLTTPFYDHNGLLMLMTESLLRLLFLSCKDHQLNKDKCHDPFLMQWVVDCLSLALKRVGESKTDDDSHQMEIPENFRFVFGLSAYKRIIYYACLCIAALSEEHKANTAVFGQLETPVLIAHALELFNLTSEKLVEAICQAIFALRLRNDQLHKAHCIKPIVEVLEYNVSNALVAEWLCKAIASLAEFGPNKQELERRGVAKLLVNVVETHALCEGLSIQAVFYPPKNSAGVAYWGCMAIYLLTRAFVGDQHSAKSTPCETLMVSQLSDPPPEDRMDQESQITEHGRFCLYLNLKRKLVEVGACEAVAKVLKRFGENEAIVSACCKALVVLLINNDAYKSKLGAMGVCSHIVDALHAFPSSSSVAKWGCRAASILAELSTSNITKLGAAGVCETVPVIIQAHLNNDHIAAVACDLIAFLCEDQRNQGSQVVSDKASLDRPSVHINGPLSGPNIDLIMRLGQSGACEAVVNILQVHMKNEVVVTSACMALAALAKVAGNASWFGPTGAVETLVKVLSFHEKSLYVAKFAISSMGNLCIVDENRERLAQVHAGQQIVSSTNLHIESLELAKAAMLTIGKMCECSVHPSSITTQSQLVVTSSDLTGQIPISPLPQGSEINDHIHPMDSQWSNSKRNSFILHLKVESMSNQHSVNKNSFRPDSPQLPVLLPNRYVDIDTKSVYSQHYMNLGMPNRCDFLQSNAFDTLYNTLHRHYLSPQLTEIVSLTVSTMCNGDLFFFEKENFGAIGLCETIHRALQKHKDNEPVVFAICLAIQSLCALSRSNQERFLKMRTPSLVVVVLRHFRNSKSGNRTIEAAAMAITNLCKQYFKAKESFGKHSACEGLLEALELFQRHQLVTYKLTCALFHICDGSKENRIKISFLGAADIVHSLLVRYTESPKMVEYLLYTMISMCTCKVGQSRLGTVGTCKSAVCLLHRLQSNNNIKKARYLQFITCTLIAMLCKGSSDNQERFRVTDVGSLLCKLLAEDHDQIQNSRLPRILMTEEMLLGKSVGDNPPQLDSSMPSSDNNTNLQIPNYWDEEALCVVHESPVVNETTPLVHIVGQFSLRKEACKAVFYFSSKNAQVRELFLKTDVLDRLTSILADLTPRQFSKEFPRKDFNKNIISDSLRYWAKKALDSLIGETNENE